MMQEIRCSICGRILSRSVDRLDSAGGYVAEGFYNYEDRIICVNCWDKGRIERQYSEWLEIRDGIERSYIRSPSSV